MMSFKTTEAWKILSMVTISVSFPYEMAIVGDGFPVPQNFPDGGVTGGETPPLRFSVLRKCRYKKTPCLFAKETGSCVQNLAVPLFLPLFATTHDDPTTVSRCIGRAPSVLLRLPFRTAAQRPVYDFLRCRLAPTGGSLEAGIRSLFPHHCVWLYVGRIITWFSSSVKR